MKTPSLVVGGSDGTGARVGASVRPSLQGTCKRECPGGTMPQALGAGEVLILKTVESEGSW
jgi:hypothetical protein